VSCQLSVLNSSCAICLLHDDLSSCDRYEILRTDHWVLRHHPDPAPLTGWLLLDSLRHCPGPIDFRVDEARSWGCVLRDSSALVQKLTGCERVYAIAFGEGAQHLHLHLIPRFISDSSTTSWAVADHYRAVADGQRSGADPGSVRDLVLHARELMS